MKNIDISSWKKFSKKKLFKLQTPPQILKSYDLNDYGTTAVYSSSTENGGLYGYTNIEPDFKVSEEIPFYIIFGDHTKAMSIVENDFSIMDNVKVLKPKVFDKDVILFILTVWKKNIPDLGYARHWAKASEVDIILPQDSDGNPDFEYMTEFIQNQKNRILNFYETLNVFERSNKVIDTSTWKEYKIEAIFPDIKRPAPRKISNYFPGTTPYVASGNYNNGVDSYREPLLGETLEKGNCVSVSPVDGSTFYQPDDFLGRGGAGSSIILLYNEYLNEYNGLFISSIINSHLTKKYEYNDMGNAATIKKEKIKLPQTVNGDIDWIFMENYIRDLMEKSKASIKLLNSI